LWSRIPICRPQQALSRCCSPDSRSSLYGFYRHLGWRSTATFDRAGDEILEWVAPVDSSADTRLRRHTLGRLTLNAGRHPRERRARCAVSAVGRLFEGKADARISVADGLLPEAPTATQPAPDCVRQTVRPVPEQISTFPLSCRGPWASGRIVRGPPRSLSRLGSDARWLARWRKIRRRHGLPVAVRFGFDFPQRHSSRGTLRRPIQS